MTNLVFPTVPYNHVKVYAEGGKAEVKTLRPIVWACKRYVPPMHGDISMKERKKAGGLS